MFSKTAVAITTLLAAAEAIKVTKPAKGDEWDLSKTNEITWDTVSTDPKSFEIVIINQSAFPATEETIATVNTADGKYELKGAKVSAGDAYRINFVSTDKENSGILAQSQEFSLTSDDSPDDKTASASATASGSASASGSATASATGASTSGSATGSAATASVTKTASGLTTVTTGTASASASGTDASASGTASGTATGSAASGTSTSAPSSASAVKSTFAIFGSVALAAYMLF